jgi:uncharacterized membrane protein (TIGR02234 family)
LTGNETTAAPRTGRREFAVLLLAGVIGAALVLFAARQQLARVEVVPGRPLPPTVTLVSGQDLLPVAWALALAALASMAAVLATRGLLRRITGGLAVLLGIGIAVTALGRISKAAVLAAAGSVNTSPAGAVGGSTPGSTTTGTDTGQTTGSLSGFPSHVVLDGTGWRALMIVGALVVVLTGLAVIIRAPRLPVMSSRYDRSAARPKPVPAIPATAPVASESSRGPGAPGADLEREAPGPAATGAGAAGTQRLRQRALLRSTSAANMWESLTSGEDPTAWSTDE